jgi:hypothetical protein
MEFYMVDMVIPSTSSWVPYLSPEFHSAPLSGVCTLWLEH